MKDLHSYLLALVERGGSDLHLVANRIPRVRIDGKLTVLDESALPVEIIEGLLSEAKSGVFDHGSGKPLISGNRNDFTLHVESLGRFRCHSYTQVGLPALAIRFIPFQIPSFKTLGLPNVLNELTEKLQGLVLVTGPVGCGKSTTLAALIDRVNEERRVHILTHEQPIEFLHPDKKSLVSQLEIEVDLPSVSSTLQVVAREDPNVVMFGEVTTREAVEAALMLAEAGTLVFLTMQTSSCLLALQNLVQYFPYDQRPLIRHRLAIVLQGMIGQTLIPRMKAAGRVLALEILLPTAAVRGLIQDDKIRQIYPIMQTGQAKHGMQTMNQALADLYCRRLISPAIALAHSVMPDELRQMIHRTDMRMKE